MASSKVVRIAPSRGGRPVASAWRVWFQGDEFYAAARDVARHGKISFHKDFKWQYRLGALVQPLAAPTPLSERWLHALEIAFLVDEDAYLPPEQAERGVILVETPADHKCLVNILRHRDHHQRFVDPPAEVRGIVLHHFRLRAGHSIIVTGRTRPMDSDDRAVIAKVRSDLRFNVERSGDIVYAEGMWQQFDARSGNAIAIVPVGPDSVSILRKAGT